MVLDSFSQKRDWATFWATFSQAHLVTLVRMHIHDVCLCFHTKQFMYRVARFFLVQHTKTGKNIPNYQIRYPQSGQKGTHGRKILQTAKKITKIVHPKALQNLPKLGFLV
jgi:hypothetical protein